MRTTLLVPALLITLFGAGCSKAADTYPASSAPVAQPSDVTTSTPTETKTYTLDEVAKHASETDCWMAVEGKVYDATSFIPNHPGGAKILNGCGKDATEMFNKVEKHGDKARETQKGLFIGDLK